MPAKKTPEKQSKAAFVRSLPSTTSTVDVIAKGKAAGLKLTKNYVYKVRTEINAKSSAKPVATALSSKTTTLSKSDFIRSQPSSLSAAAVVAKARAAGLEVSSALVYMARGRAGAKKVVAKKTPPTPKTVTSKAASVTVNKADFVRARAHLSPKEIVEDAKAAGIKFDDKYVYNIRGYDKSKGKKKRAARKTSTLAVANGTLPTTTTSSSEDLLRAVAAEVGLGRAIELLQGERARVSAILRG